MSLDFYGDLLDRHGGSTLLVDSIIVSAGGGLFWPCFSVCLPSSPITCSDLKG